MAIVSGTRTEQIIEHVSKIDSKKWQVLIEITVDMANSMKLIAKEYFPKAIQVTDRFHVQKLALEALQEIRIKHRWEAMYKENQAISQFKTEKKPHNLPIWANGETVKQLLSRSRYILYKPREKWTNNQQERASLLFELYPDIKKAYILY